jgi:hypothetical protein
MQYRLIKNVYTPRVVRNENSGSTQDVVHDKVSRVYKEWERLAEVPEELVLCEAQSYLPSLDEFEDPRIEESYRLECRENDSCAWQYVGTLYPKLEE